MIIGDFDPLRSFIGPDETDPVLVVDPDTVLSLPVGRQVAGIVLAAAGYRVRGQGHHQIAFYGLAVLEDPLATPLDLRTGPAGIEPATPGFGDRCSTN
jgi:hypothetical protein